MKGYSDDKIVCRFEATFNKKQYEMDVAIKPNNLALEAKDAEKKMKSEHSKLTSKYPWLKGDVKEGEEEDANPGEEILAWEADLMSADDQVTGAYTKAIVTTAIASLADHSTEVDSKNDILIMKKSGKYQLWTLREFKAGTLLLAPESLEIKSRFYSQGEGRSVIVKGAEDASEKGRPFVIDGRVRGAPSSKTSFALFWMIDRLDPKVASNKKLINMSTSNAKIKLSCEIEVEGSKLSSKKSNVSELEIPVLVNEKKISKGVQLFAKADGLINELYSRQLADDLKLKRKKEENDAKDKDAKKPKLDDKSSSSTKEK